MGHRRALRPVEAGQESLRVVAPLGRLAVRRRALFAGRFALECGTQLSDLFFYLLLLDLVADQSHR